MRKHLVLGLVGGAVYALMELLWRGRTHWSMVLLGGMCFVVIGLLNEIYTWDMALVSQMAISAVIITAGELVTGLIVNVWWGLGVWDYSDMPYNLWGQVCLLYSCIWYGLSLVAILLDDWLRYKWWHERKPRYKIL